jgi:hypothetical protein
MDKLMHDGRGHVLVRKERREAPLDEFERCGVEVSETLCVGPILVINPALKQNAKR